MSRDRTHHLEIGAARRMISDRYFFVSQSPKSIRTLLFDARVTSGCEALRPRLEEAGNVSRDFLSMLCRAFYGKEQAIHWNDQWQQRRVSNNQTQTNVPRLKNKQALFLNTMKASQQTIFILLVLLVCGTTTARLGATEGNLASNHPQNAKDAIIQEKSYHDSNTHDFRRTQDCDFGLDGVKPDVNCTIDMNDDTDCQGFDCDAVYVGTLVAVILIAILVIVACLIMKIATMLIVAFVIASIIAVTGISIAGA